MPHTSSGTRRFLRAQRQASLRPYLPNRLTIRFDHPASQVRTQLIRQCTGQRLIGTKAYLWASSTLITTGSAPRRALCTSVSSRRLRKRQDGDENDRTEMKMFTQLMRPRVVVLGLAFAALGLSAANAQSAGRSSSSAPLSGSDLRALSAQLRNEPKDLAVSRVVSGLTWSVVTYPSAPAGVSCGWLKEPVPAGTFGQNSPATYMMSGGCDRTNSLFTGGPINERHGWVNRGSAAGEWVWGYASPQAQTVSVKLADCSLVSVPVANGVFLYVADTASLGSGGTPVSLTAKGSNGTTIGSVSIARPPAAVAALPAFNGTPFATSASAASTC